MYPLVEFPELVKHYAPFFEEVFSPEAFIEFKRYVSGLIVSENKTVDGINRLFVTESRNQKFAQSSADGESVFAGGIEPGALIDAGQSARDGDQTEGGVGSR